MRIFIAEDEPPARERLIAALARVAPEASICGHADSVRATALWLASHPAPDLLLLDIQLADGLSLELFQERELTVPTIFTTAYDRFAIDAFRALAVDYLLKPVNEQQLADALAKAERLRRHFGTGVVDGLAQPGARTKWRQRLVGRRGNEHHALAVDDIAYVVAVEKASFAVTRDGARYRIEAPLAEVEAGLDPVRFFRASRQVLVAAHAVAHFAPAGKGRLKLALKPALDGELLVTQERAAAFRAWIGG